MNKHEQRRVRVNFNFVQRKKKKKKKKKTKILEYIKIISEIRSFVSHLPLDRGNGKKEQNKERE